jgi:hypothetical protein
MTAPGAERKCWHDALPAAIGGNAENICPSRVLLSMTQSGPRRSIELVNRGRVISSLSGENDRVLLGLHDRDRGLVPPSERQREWGIVIERVRLSVRPPP